MKERLIDELKILDPDLGRRGESFISATFSDPQANLFFLSPSTEILLYTLFSTTRDTVK